MSFPFPTFTNTFHNSIYPSISPTNYALSAARNIVPVTGGGNEIGEAMAMSFATAGAPRPVKELD
jgi:hypothetical protein